jgi:predicted Zn-dependent protease with MMP-like domain
LVRDKVSHRGFDPLVERALVTLPDEFQSYLENVVVVIEEEPPADMPDVMGLYEGIPLVERSLDDTNLPDHITLFKGRLCVPAILMMRLRVKYVSRYSTR